jgi:hypothetical protein
MDQIRLRYEVNFEEIDSKLKELKSKVKKHKTQFEKNSSNWGFVGDLSHINTELENLVKFLK